MKTKILFTGDVMFDRSIYARVEDGEDPFEFVLDVFAEHDLVVINLETNVSARATGKPWPNKSYSFKSPAKCLSILKNAGVNIVNLANNHVMDYGAEALGEQLDLLDDAGIKRFGAGRSREEAYSPLYVNLGAGKGGCKMAFLGFNTIAIRYGKVSDERAGMAVFSREWMPKMIRQARKEADLVFVLPHWGYEFTQRLSPMQKKYEKLFVDWGADMIVGNHPHVLQKHKKVNGKSVYYSLGNFVFDSGRKDPSVRKGGMLSVEIDNCSIIGEKLIPVNIDAKGYPHLA